MHQLATEAAADVGQHYTAEAPGSLARLWGI